MDTLGGDANRGRIDASVLAFQLCIVVSQSILIEHAIPDAVHKCCTLFTSHRVANRTTQTYRTRPTADTVLLKCSNDGIGSTDFRNHIVKLAKKPVSQSTRSLEHFFLFSTRHRNVLRRFVQSLQKIFPITRAYVRTNL
jgi:hypothetical protein